MYTGTMAAGTYDMTMEYGETFRRALTYMDDSGKRVNLTNYTAEMVITKGSPSATPILTLATGGQGITLGGVNGTIELHLSREAVNAAPFTAAAYFLYLTSPNGDTVRILQGKIRRAG